MFSGSKHPKSCLVLYCKGYSKKRTPCSCAHHEPSFCLSACFLNMACNMNLNTTDCVSRVEISMHRYTTMKVHYFSGWPHRCNGQNGKTGEHSFVIDLSECLTACQWFLLAEILARLSWDLFIFIMYKKTLDQSIRKLFYLMLKTETLLMVSSVGFTFIPCVRSLESSALYDRILFQQKRFFALWFE